MTRTPTPALFGPINELDAVSALLAGKSVMVKTCDGGYLSVHGIGSDDVKRRFTVLHIRGRRVETLALHPIEGATAAIAFATRKAMDVR